MEAQKQQSVSQQQALTPTSIQTETTESEMSPSARGKRKVQTSAESGHEKSTTSEQPPPAKRQHTDSSVGRESSETEANQRELDSVTVREDEIVCIRCDEGGITTNSFIENTGEFRDQ
jgi:hypothetical protein